MNKQTTPATFAQALASHLESRGLTQRHLALMLGVTEGMVSHYLTSKRQPGVELMERIAEALESKLEYTPGRGWGFIY